jgi:beta-carotene hydroxylase
MSDVRPAQAMTDAEAARIAMNEAAKPAWGTVAMFVVEISLWALSGYAAITHMWPMWLCFLVSLVAIYMNYTPHHEAVHGNIAGNNRNLVWLNELIGSISGLVFYHGFTLQRITHLTHHAYANDPKEDPDHWAHGRNPFAVVLRCLTILFPYEVHGWRIVWRAKNRWPTMLRAALEHVIAWGGMIALFATGHWDAAIFAFILPALIASGMLAFMFDWLVHHPHDKPVGDRYRNSNAYLFPKSLHAFMTTIWLYQNYHIIHHLYPRVPFYRYPRVFDRIRPLLRAQGTPITVFRWRPDAFLRLTWSPDGAAPVSQTPPARAA